MRRAIVLFVLLVTVFGFAKDKKKGPLVLGWPKDKPALQITLDTFQDMGAPGKTKYYRTDAQIENLTDKPFPASTLALVFFDAENVQIGETSIYIGPALAARQKMRRELAFNTAGKPVRLELRGPTDVALSADRMLAVHAVSVSIRSSPSGANIEVDGRPYGVTPKILKFPVGSHTLVLTKAGFDRSEFPFEVSETDGSGGSIDVELPASNDILELRDGTSLGGDLESMTWDSVTLLVGGKPVSYPRNEIKRILLVKRTHP